MTDRTVVNQPNQTQFTPGPWEYGEAKNYGGFYIAPKGALPTLAAVMVCGVQNVSLETFNFPGSTEANARLIAAAPEMYAALKSVQLQLLQSNNNTEYAQEALDLARAALDKAVKP